MVCHWARATDTKAHKSVSVKRRLARISNGEFARRGGRTEGFLHFSALLGTRHMAAFVRDPLSLWALDVFFFLFFPGKGFLFCMAVNRSKGARGIRRRFVDYIVWQAECETAYLLNLLKVISWLILFVRANLATSKGTPHLHIPQKWIFLVHISMTTMSFDVLGEIKAVSVDYSMAGGFGGLVVDNCSWNFCSECCQMDFFRLWFE